MQGSSVPLGRNHASPSGAPSHRRALRIVLTPPPLTAPLHTGQLGGPRSCRFSTWGTKAYGGRTWHQLPGTTLSRRRWHVQGRREETHHCCRWRSGGTWIVALSSGPLRRRRWFRWFVSRIPCTPSSRCSSASRTRRVDCATAGLLLRVPHIVLWPGKRHRRTRTTTGEATEGQRWWCPCRRWTKGAIRPILGALRH